MAPTPWHVARIRAEGENEVVEVPEQGLLLGRGEDCGLPLPGPEHPGVSLHHARLEPAGEHLVLIDQGSRNGTLVHGRRIERFELSHGSTFQLGNGGPRFVVYSSDRLDETVLIPRPARPTTEERRVGSQTMFLLRRKLGIPQGADVGQMVRRRSRRNLFVNMAVLAALVLVITLIYERRQEAVARELDEQKQETRALAAELAEARDLAETQRLASEERAAHFAAERDRLIADRDRLAESIARLELEGKSGAQELVRLKGRLETTSRRLDLYDPVNLENERLQRVAGFENVVVLIESSIRWREVGGDRLLYYETDEAGYPHPNLEGRGELLERSATGSGFCVSADGWILTNAHVVLKEEEPEETLELASGLTMEPELELFVTFSGETTRHRAKLVDWRRDRRQDLALLEIAPFAGIPHLEVFEFDAEKPAPGSDVFLIGFPGGKSILQEGDRMLASTFRGIVSRTVDYYVQVDAVVHPGVSGGPVIDGKGRLVGVVTGMQTLDEVSAASAIGYVIPISEVEKVWPPGRVDVNVGGRHGSDGDGGGSSE